MQAAGSMPPSYDEGGQLQSMQSEKVEEQDDFDSIEKGSQADNEPGNIVLFKEWAIMDIVPQVLPTLHPGQGDLLIVMPPDASFLRVPRSVGQDAKIVAVDPTGALLICGSGSRLVLLHPLRADGESGQPVFSMHEVCHPRPPIHPIAHHVNVGLMACSDGAFMIAELQLVKSTISALMITNKGLGDWKEVEIRCPETLQKRAWEGHGMISHEDCFWWFDLSSGLLKCNVFDDHPVMEFIELPYGCVLEKAGPNIKQRRCISVSDEKIRYVQILDDEENPRAASVSVWTFTKCGGQGGSLWKQEFLAIFSDIWNDTSYYSLPLPEMVPALCFLHPINPCVVYFTLAGHMFGANLCNNKVYHHSFGNNSFAYRHMIKCPAVRPNSRLAFMLPHFLSTDEGAKSYSIVDSKLPVMELNLPSWILLCRSPRVRDDCGGAAITLTFASPPGISMATMHSAAFACNAAGASIVSADNSGLLLVVSWELNKPLLELHVFDAVNGCATDLGLRSAVEYKLDHARFLGLLTHPVAYGSYIQEVGYIVVQLRMNVSDNYGEGQMLCFSSADRKWVIKRVRHPELHRRFEDDGVVAHMGKIWWFDLSSGLLTCNPLDHVPFVRFIPLPPGTSDIVIGAHKYRGLRFIGDKLYFVDIFDDTGYPKNIRVWQLADTESSSVWVLEQQTSFDDIWADQTYEATSLPKQDPELALIHPHKPNVIYFFLKKHIFGVDLLTHKVVGDDAYDLVNHPYQSAVYAWEPPADALNRTLISKPATKICSRLYALS